MLHAFLLVEAYRRLRFDARARERRRGGARATLWLVGCLLVVAGLSGRASASDAGEAGLQLGRELAGSPPGRSIVEIDGERLELEVTTAPGTVGAILDDAQRGCGGLPLRREGDADGVVLCVAKGERPLPEALAALAETDDITALGRIDYTYAHIEPGGLATRLALRTAGPLRLGALASAGPGDAPGSDGALTPRPEGARRMFSARIAGSRGIYAYETARDAAAVEGELDRAMRGKGARRVTRETKAGRVVAWSLGPGGPTVYATVKDDGKRRVVTLVESR